MKNLITEREVLNLHKQGNTIVTVGINDIITPAAQDKIKQYRIKIVRKEEVDKIITSESTVSFSSKFRKVVIGCDHTGFKVKNLLSKILTEKKYDVTDVGTHDENSCDYPDFALAVAKKVKDKSADFGILIDATGIPSAIAANKVKGIRAATCYNEFSARSAREHNNANILVIGAKALGEETICSILEAWLTTNFGGGRHQRRLDKITKIENDQR
jgi:ribose 5-phosphate isomerase B